MFGLELPPEKLQQRESVYLIYQEMGMARSINRLERVLREKHPELHVARPSLEKWSVQHNWATRVKTFDDAIGNDRAARATAMTAVDVEDDPIAALLKLTNQTLARALAAAPVVTKPNEVKSLIDSATNALKLAEQIKASQTSKTIAAEIAEDVARVLDLMAAKRREDGLEMAIEIICEQGHDASMLEAELRELRE